MASKIIYLFSAYCNLILFFYKVIYNPLATSITYSSVTTRNYYWISKVWKTDHAINILNWTFNCFLRCLLLLLLLLFFLIIFFQNIFKLLLFNHWKRIPSFSRFNLLFLLYRPLFKYLRNIFFIFWYHIFIIFFVLIFLSKTCLRYLRNPSFSLTRYLSFDSSNSRSFLSFSYLIFWLLYFMEIIF